MGTLAGAYLSVHTPRYCTIEAAFEGKVASEVFRPVRDGLDDAGLLTRLHRRGLDDEFALLQLPQEPVQPPRIGRKWIALRLRISHATARGGPVCRS